MRIDVAMTSTPMHVNPNQIACVYHDAGDYPTMQLGSGEEYEIEQDSYERIVEWMEKHDE